jgi:hypothetical protein
MPRKIASISRLPFEIHRHFLLYFRPSEDCDHNPIRDLGPLMLVCKNWADIILHTPSFWTTIYITFGSSEPLDESESSLQKFIEHSQALFMRAGGALLNIHMDLWPHYEIIMDRLLNFLGKYGKINQWKRLEIKGSRSGVWYERQRCKSNLSQLTKLGGFHNLEWLSTDNVYYTILLRWIDVTSPQLNTLSIDSLEPFSGIQDIRRIFPNIINHISFLNLRGISFDEDNVEDFQLSPTITNLALDKLPPHSINPMYITHLSIHGAGYPREDLDQDVYPNLETLDVESALWYEPFNTTLPSVKHLDIGHSVINIEGLCLPSLATLRVREPQNCIYHKLNPFISAKELIHLP